MSGLFHKHSCCDNLRFCINLLSYKILEKKTLVAWRFRDSQQDLKLNNPISIQFPLCFSSVLCWFPYSTKMPFSWFIISSAHNCLLPKIPKKAFGKSSSKF